MAAKTIPFGSFDIGGGDRLDVTMTYDDVTNRVSSFDWVNPKPAATTLTITVDGAPTTRTIQPGPGSYNPPGQITLQPGPKGGLVFPFSVSVAPG